MDAIGFPGSGQPQPSQEDPSLRVKSRELVADATGFFDPTEG